VNGLKILFGEREGRMYGPMELPTGLACDAFCPSCHAPLIAKNRHFSSLRRTAHFSHAHGLGRAACFVPTLSDAAANSIERICQKLWKGPARPLFHEY
jgi:hypothetical protein